MTRHALKDEHAERLRRFRGRNRRVLPLPVAQDEGVAVLSYRARGRDDLAYRPYAAFCSLPDAMIAMQALRKLWTPASGTNSADDGAEYGLELPSVTLCVVHMGNLYA